MKIFSKFHDYYDVAMRYGVDEDTSYVRNTIELQSNSELYKRILNHVKSKIDIGCLTYSKFSYFCILFCGSMYFATKKYSLVSQNERCFYDYDSMASYYKHDEDVIHFLETGNSNRRYKHWFRTETLKDVFNKFPLLKDPETIDIQQSTSPIITVNYSNIRNIEIHIDPMLKPLEFYRVVDPFTAYQELFMFVSGVMGGTSPKMIQIQDKVRFEKHGFDSKISFRNVK